MNMRGLCKFGVVILYLLIGNHSLAQKFPDFPLKVSKNGRYFVDQNDHPFLYHADTGWKLFSQLTEKECLEYFTVRKSQGFNTIQAMIAYTPEDRNQNGDAPFLNNNDFSSPNEAYFDHIIKMVHKADSLGLLVVLTQPWLGCCKEGFGGTPDHPIQRNGPEKNKMLGRYLGQKFRDCKNLFRILGGDNDPKGDRESLFAFFDGLYESASRYQLMTYHASTPHSSTDLFQYAPWLGFSFIYTYWREKINAWNVYDLLPHVYEAALREWEKSDKMPFVLGESQYEGFGDNENVMGTPHMIRRQAYWTILCGGAGQAYGCDAWEFPDGWREMLQYTGAQQLKYFIDFFNQVPWWTLQPDVKHLAVVDGYGDWSKPNYVTTAVSEDRRTLVSYIPELISVTVNFGFLEGENFSVRFFDPRTGLFVRDETVTNTGVKRIVSPPGEDLVLIIESQR